MRDWLRKDFRIPWGAWAEGLGRGLVFLLLPNVFFALVAYFLGVARPLINIDYIWAGALFALPWGRWRWLGRILAIGALFAAWLLDALMMAMQLFPFLDMAAAISLAPFLAQAPLRYVALVAVALLYAVFLACALSRFGARFFGGRLWIGAVLAAALLFCAYHKFHEIKYFDGRVNGRFAQGDHFVIHSQYQRYRWAAGSEFALHFSKTPTMIPIDAPRASMHLGAIKTGVAPFVSRPIVRSPDDPAVGDRGMDVDPASMGAPSDKILFVVAESWGVARSSAVQTAILQGVYDRADKLRFLDNGYFNFAGATVEGELRELCQLDVDGGYAFNRLSAADFARCLPYRLKKDGYTSVALHTGFSAIYERDALYKLMGFDRAIFAENLGDRRRCRPFNGVCDSEAIDTIRDTFKKHDKLFFYWLTLTSHSPFDQKDLRSPRLDCAKFDLPKGDICNNFRLHAQFFDDLATLIDDPALSGTEVIVVGDHMPPIMSSAPIYNHIQWQDVAWVHFRIK